MKQKVTYTAVVCDNCGAEVPEGKGASMRITPADRRASPRAADLCDKCTADMPGQAVKRRGRKPAVA